MNNLSSHLNNLSSEHFLQAINVIPSPMAISVFTSGLYLYVNENFLTTLGYRLEEVIGKTSRELSIFADIEERTKATKILLETGRLRNFETLICTKSGELRMGLFAAEFIEIKGEKYLLSLMVDITDRKKLEERLLQERQRLYSILDEFPGLVALQAENLTPVYANQVFKKLFGEYNDRPCYRVLGKESPCEVCHTKLLFKKGEPTRWELSNKDTGTYDVVEKLVYDIDGTPLALKVGIDITSRKLAEQELLHSEEKYRTFFENSLDGTVLSKEDGTIVSANDAFCTMLGMTEQEVIKKGAQDLIDWTDKRLTKLISDLQKNGKVRGEFNLIHKNGSKVPVEASIQTFSGRNGEEYISSICRDLTEKLKIQQEISRLDRLNIIGQIAAGIGHEVRNPMTTVRGFLQLLSGKPKYLADNEYFELMISELDRANSIITDFLSLAKNSSVNLQLQNLNNIINDLQPLLQADALNSDKEIRVEQTPIPEININKKEIHQLILNLVRNGLEAMPVRGTVTIKTYMDGEEVVLAIQDEGPGIDPVVFDKLGTPFLTTKPEGTGLGLATCYNIAARNDAKISVETGVEGTTFSVRFIR